jgi:O-antigen/teichoic acid export membrane protein
MINFKTKIILNSIIYIVLPKFSFFITIISLPWISPFLSLKDYGIYAVLISYITIFQTIVSIGQNLIIQNSFFTHKSKYKLVWCRSFAIMLINAILMSILFYICCLTFLNNLLGYNLKIVFTLISIYLLLSPFG